MVAQNVQVPGMGKRIKELREGMGITQGELAKRLGSGRTIVSTYEQGTRSPSYAKLIRLAEIFNVSTDYLLGYEVDAAVDLSGLNDKKRRSVENLVQTLR